MLDHYHKNSASFNATSTDKHSLSCMPNTFSDFIYSGERDEALMRKGMGCNNAKKDNLWETYIGNFVLDNEHGDGTFKWKTDQGDFAYEGYVFCNHITGYGRFSYPDGSMHEGLYKSNCRFGPGVYTEPSGRQSVGIWQNKKLVRLTIKVETGVPTLATTPQGKAKILGYRNILFIDKGVSDKAKEILMEMNAPSHILNISECLYNIYGKDNRSLNFNWPLYNKIFSPTTRAQKPSIVSIAESTISEQINRSIKSESKFTRKKLKQATLKETKIIIDTERRKREFDTLMQNATHLISWNNSPIIEEILLYCFKHYHQEDIITYNLADVLKNRRSHFRAPGIHETLCVRFLKRCHVGDHWRVDDYLAFKAIDPNVADCEGNTGLITAAANDQLAVIDVILDRGANINMCNNEGLTPLSLCMTRYLAIVGKVKDWEKAFLNTQVERNYAENVLKWRHPDIEPEDQEGTFDDESLRESTKITTEEFDGEDRDQFPVLSNESLNKMATIKETILKLLRRGADPQRCNIPMTILIMAVKCRDEDIVRNLLEAGADPNERVPPQEGDFTPLFLAVQLPADDTMVGICRLLLKHGADPNVGIDFSEDDVKMFQFCELEDDEFGMKTVLHALVTRDDGNYVNEHMSAVLSMLIANKADPHALFLGHSPLSAAIVKGNVNMIQSLLDTNKVDPNQHLADRLGVPLTTLLTMGCAPNVPIEDAAEIINTLVDKGANLLATVQVGDYRGSIIEFAHKEYELHKGKSRSSAVASNKKSDQDYRVLLEYTTKLARELVIKTIKNLLKKTTKPKQRSAIGGSKSLSQRTGGSAKYSEVKSKRGKSVVTRTAPMKKSENILPEWLSPDDVVYVLNHIQDSENIPITREKATSILKMAVPNDTREEEFKKLLSQVKGMTGYVDPTAQPLHRRSLKKIVSSNPWSLLAFPGKSSSSLGGKIRMPSRFQSSLGGIEVSDHGMEYHQGKKFGKCFGCEQRFRQELLTLCPECQRVKFCSEECFLKARRNHTHMCKTNISFHWKDHNNEKHQSRKGSKSDKEYLKRESADAVIMLSKWKEAGQKENAKKGGGRTFSSERGAVKESIIGYTSNVINPIDVKRKSDLRKRPVSQDHKSDIDKKDGPKKRGSRKGHFTEFHKDGNRPKVVEQKPKEHSTSNNRKYDPSKIHISKEVDGKHDFTTKDTNKGLGTEGMSKSKDTSPMQKDSRKERRTDDGTGVIGIKEQKKMHWGHMGQGDAGDGRIQITRKSTQGKADLKGKSGKLSEGGDRRQSRPSGTWTTATLVPTGASFVQSGIQEVQRSRKENDIEYGSGISFIVQQDGNLYHMANGKRSLQKENYAFA